MTLFHEFYSGDNGIVNGFETVPEIRGTNARDQLPFRQDIPAR
jgi:hypothetical protein